MDSKGLERGANWNVTTSAVGRAGKHRPIAQEQDETYEQRSFRQ